MFLLEEIGVEAAMILATVTAAVIFVWAAGTMLLRWMRYVKAEDSVPDQSMPASAHTPRLAGPSL